MIFKRRNYCDNLCKYAVVVSIVGLVLMQTVSAAVADGFEYLDRLVIGSTVPPEIIEQATKEPNRDPQNQNRQVYTVPSSQYSHPHILHLEDGKLVFLQLSVPRSKQSVLVEQFKSLGKAPVEMKKSETEYYYGYPEQGMAFVVTGATRTIVRVQKFPVKSEDRFKKEEAKYYKPVNMDRLIVQSNPPWYQKIWNNIQLRIIVLVAGSVVSIGSIVLIRWMVKRHRRHVEHVPLAS